MVGILVLNATCIWKQLQLMSVFFTVLGSLNGFFTSVELLLSMCMESPCRCELRPGYLYFWGFFSCKKRLIQAFEIIVEN